MTSKKQSDANRSNAKKSTGPRTPRGKKAITTNATKHGLTSTAPVVTSAETIEQWTQFSTAFIADLAPVGPVELSLAERASNLMWRIRRIERYESEAANVVYEKAAEAIDNAKPPAPHERSWTSQIPAEKKLAEFRRQIDKFDCEAAVYATTAAMVRGYPEIVVESRFLDPTGILEILEELVGGGYEIDFDPDLRIALDLEAENTAVIDYKWNAEMVHDTVRFFASKLGTDEQELVRTIVDEAGLRAAETETTLTSLRECATKLQAQVDRKKNQLARENLVPNDEVLKTVSRHEAHLNRQLLASIHELERLQAKRIGRDDS